MKLLTQICRWLLGCTLIFSGLIKLNDPYGFSYKLKEYFEVFATDFGDYWHLFIPYSLYFAFAICTLEIVLGVAILLNYRVKSMLWVTFSLLLFFAFLTFYSAYFDKVKECGCFGDFIKFSPWESFCKDLFLLLLLLILLINQNKLSPAFSNLVSNFIVGATIVLAFFGGGYSIQHLPYMDFRPYAVGKNIKTEMQPEEEPLFVYKMEKGGKEYQFKKYPTDTSFKYKGYKVLNPEKSQPKVTDYQIWNEEGDYTDSSLVGTKLFIIIKDAKVALYSASSLKHLEKISKLVNNLGKTDIKPIVLTASPTQQIEELRHEVQLAAPYYYMDDVQLKTMIRANIGLILIENGTIKGKWHQNDVPTLKAIKLVQN